MRVPMPIQATESSGGQWLIHRRETAQPRKSSRNIRRVLRQSIHKAGFEQVGMFWSASMMDQSNDGIDPAPSDEMQLCFGRLPCFWLGEVRFPENRIAQFPNSQFCHPIDIIRATAVPVALTLVKELVAHAVHGAFHPTPHLDPSFRMIHF